MKAIRALLLAVLSFHCFGVFAGALDNWHWRNPLPNGNPPPSPYNLYGIVFTNNTFFAVGDLGVIFTSPDGTNWTQGATATTNGLAGIVYGGGQFVAVGANGTVETSANGTNWVLRNSGTTSGLGAVAYGNGKFVAVGGAVISSANGVNWTSSVSGLSSAGMVAGSGVGFVAVNGTGTVYFSLDGLNWTSQALPIPPGDTNNTFYNNIPLVVNTVTVAKGTFLLGGYKWMTSLSADVCVYASGDGNNWSLDVADTTSAMSININFFVSGGSNEVLVAHSFGDSPVLFFSPDDTNWIGTAAPPNSYVPGNGGAYGNGVYVIVLSSKTFYTSTDAVNWATENNVPAAATGPTGTFYSIAASNTLYVAATSSSFAESTNGAGFSVESNTPSLSSVIGYNNYFVSVGGSGQVYLSTNGSTWVQHNSGTANNLHGVAAGNNLLVAVGDSGTIQTSPTGVIWTSRFSGTSLALYSVVYSNGQYVAVGQEGTVMTSPDGASWTAQDSGVLNNLYSVTYGAAGFLAVGTNGTIITSPDGENWATQNSGVSTLLESATFGNGYYLVDGANTVVLTSPDGSTWTPRNVGATGGQTLYGSAFLNGRFDVVGSGGTVIESDAVTPLFDLQIHGQAPQNYFTLFATPGMNFRLLSSTNVNSSWNTLATFNNAAAITWWTNSSSGYSRCFFRLVSP